MTSRDELFLPDHKPLDVPGFKEFVKLMAGRIEDRRQEIVQFMEDHPPLLNYILECEWINRGIPKEKWHPVVDRSWQQSVTEEERTQLQNVIAHATNSVKTWSLKAFFLETSVFRRAGSRDEYYRMLGEEIQQSVIKMEKDLAKSKSMLTKLKESVQTN